MKPVLLPTVTMLFLVSSGSTSAQEQEASRLVLQDAEVRAGGRSFDAQYGHLRVPQHHDDPEAGEIQLAVLVRRSTASKPGPPIFYLNGIPESAIDVAGDEHWDDYLALGDLVFFDQRGSGRSDPTLRWERPPYRAEVFLSERAAALQNLLDTVAVIRTFTALRGVDLAAFNTRESACDVDLLRRALGYEKIRLVGHSGGTHLGFEVVRRFGQHVASFVSLGTAGPNDIESLPSQLDGFLHELSRRVAADERIGEQMPNLYERIEQALDRVDEQPLTFALQHPESGKAVELHLGRHGLQLLLVMELGDPEDLALFPRLVHELEHGHSDVLRWYVERRYRQLTSLPVLLFVNRAASGATAERWQTIRREAASSPFGLVRCFFSPELDEALGVVDLGDGFRAPVESDVPALFVSGTLDGKTPPERAERARRGFPHSVHVVLENGGHNDLVQRPEVHARILRFLAGEELQDERIDLPQLRFALLEGDDPLVSHPALERS